MACDRVRERFPPVCCLSSIIRGERNERKEKERKGGKKKRWERNRERERVREVREGWKAVLLLVVVVVDSESGHVHCSALILDPACRFVRSIGGSGADPRAIFPRLSSSRVCVRKKASRSRREGGGVLPLVGPADETGRDLRPC